ncbi:hypothetical protein PR048_030274 [Dryococelus australis]|uniref:Uncharacterized protein n=1 Tax=Dryococelus australis TaxID=614101 RepID=A0ABQ9G8I2_9NEOP|nr:hypothetical protein PR048_030274 [Dryococelus australis]
MHTPHPWSSPSNEIAWISLPPAYPVSSPTPLMAETFLQSVEHIVTPVTCSEYTLISTLTSVGHRDDLNEEVTLWHLHADVRLFRKETAAATHASRLLCDRSYDLLEELRSLCAIVVRIRRLFRSQCFRDGRDSCHERNVFGNAEWWGGRFFTPKWVELVERDDLVIPTMHFIPGRVSNFRMRESCRTMPLVGGFSRGSPVSPAPSFRRAAPPSPQSPSPDLNTLLLKPPKYIHSLTPLHFARRAFTEVTAQAEVKGDGGVEGASFVAVYFMVGLSAVASSRRIRQGIIQRLKAPPDIGYKSSGRNICTSVMNPGMYVRLHLYCAGKAFKLNKWVPPHTHNEQQRGMNCFSFHRNAIVFKRVLAADPSVKLPERAIHRSSPRDPAPHTARPHHNQTKWCTKSWYQRTKPTTADLHSQQLEQMQRTLEQGEPSLANRKGVLLLHHNTRPHVARFVPGYKPATFLGDTVSPTVLPGPCPNRLSITCSCGACGFDCGACVAILECAESIAECAEQSVEHAEHIAKHAVVVVIISDSRVIDQPSHTCTSIYERNLAMKDKTRPALLLANNGLARKHLANPITARCGATANEHTAEAPSSMAINIFAKCTCPYLSELWIILRRDIFSLWKTCNRTGKQIWDYWVGRDGLGHVYRKPAAPIASSSAIKAIWKG